MDDDVPRDTVARFRCRCPPPPRADDGSLMSLMSSAGGSGYTVKSRVHATLPAILKQWWLWLLIPGCFASWTHYIEEYDSIRVARCDAYCNGKDTDKCIDNCLSSNYTKPGLCPNEASMSPFEAACLRACNDDSRCPDLAKCCEHDCGVTCMHPTGLNNRTDLPPIPKYVQIRQEKNNVVLLTWQDPKGIRTNKSTMDMGVRYLVEERHLIGPRYIESRLSPWAVRHVAMTSYTTLQKRLKTGHWYQFRVAAINKIGSKGYSRPSRPFKTKDPRKPREPQNLTLSNARLVDGKLRIILQWSKPKSDIPIMFYKVFWSRLIRGPTNDSVLVYHRTILKEKSCYELKEIELKSQYFLQVQAVALYGGRRLASLKASKVFNSTDYMAYAATDKMGPHKCEQSHDGLHLRRMTCHDGQIKARLVWPVRHDVKAYNVSWKEETCVVTRENPLAHRKKLMWKIVKLPHFEIKHLRRECMYSVNVQNIFSDNTYDENGANIEFYASSCRKELEERNNLSTKKMIRCRTAPRKWKRH